MSLETGRIRPRARARALATPLLALALLVVAGGCTSMPSPGTPEAKEFHKRGLEHFDATRYDEAIDQFNLALRVDPEYAVCMADLALAYHRRGNSQRAIDELLHIIDAYPDVADAYNNLGEVYLDLKRYAEAEEQLNLAIETYPGYYEAYYNLGRLYQTRNERDKALDAFTTATRYNVKFVPAHVAAGLLYLGEGLTSFKDKDAEEHFKLALEYDKTNPFAAHGLGVIALRREQWEEAIRHFRASLEAQPKNPIVLKDLALAYERAGADPRSRKRVSEAFAAAARKALDAGKPEEALTELDAAANIDPKLVDVPVLRAQCYLNMKPARLDEADRAAKSGFALAPKHRDVRFTLAVVAMAQQRWQVAEDLLRGLRRELPKVAKHHKYLGVCFFKQKRPRLAERAFLDALKLEPDDKQTQANLETLYRTPTFKKANELNDKAVAALRAGKFREASDLLKDTVEIDSQFAVAFSNLAFASAELGDLKVARTYAERAIQLDPDLGRAHNNLGIVNLREGKLAEAKRSFALAAEFDPGDPEPRFNLGSIHLQEGNAREAEGQFELALGIDPNHFRAHYALGLLYMLKGLDGKAEARFRLANGANDKFIPGRVALARLYLKQKKYADAMRELEEANRLDDGDPEPWLGFGEAQQALGEARKAFAAYLEGASRATARGRFQEAVEACQRAVALDGENDQAHGDLGVALMNVGRLTDALAELKRADDLSRKRPAAEQTLLHRYNLGLCYAKMGDGARAAACFREILGQNPKIARAKQALAELYAERDPKSPVTRAEAIELLRDALRLETDLEKKQKIQQRLTELER